MKNGLDYFPIDIDFFDDEKMQFVSARFGVKGELVTIRLLSRIYRNGYFINWDEDSCLLLSRKCGEGITAAFVSDVVDELIKRGFFNKDIFNSFKVLTSNGIQKRFFDAVKRRKQVTVIKQFLVADPRLYENVDIIIENVNIQDGNANILGQSRVSKGSKVTEGEQSKKSPPPVPHLFKDSEFFDKELFFKQFDEPKYADADLEHYYESARNWSESKNEKKASWIATVRNWMNRDLKEGRFVSKHNNNQNLFTNGNTVPGKQTATGKNAAAIEQYIAKAKAFAGPNQAGE